MAVTNLRQLVRRFGAFCALLLAFMPAHSATLPPDAVEMMYHSYEGDEIKIDGPAVLVRKSIGNQFSLSAQYLVDTITSASIDVRAEATSYEEERTEYTAGVDFLQDKTLISAGYSNSTENDFEANTVFFAVSQSFFGDLTTINMGYSNGWDEIRKTGDDDFVEEAKRQGYSLGVTQILTKNALLSVNVEARVDEGFLNNPYRFSRFLDTDPVDSSIVVTKISDNYPETRTTNAVSGRVLYYLPYRASIKAEYRHFNDSWGITSGNFEVEYVHPIGDHMYIEAKTRFHDQSKADFYSDLFPDGGSPEFFTRDKEMSTMTSQSYGVGFSMEYGKGVVPGIDALKFSLLYELIEFEYEDFTDVTTGGTFLPGEEPLFSFDADVIRALFIVEF